MHNTKTMRHGPTLFKVAFHALGDGAAPFRVLYSSPASPNTCSQHVLPLFLTEVEVDSGAKRACQHGRLARRCDVEEFMHSLFISWFDYRIKEDLMSVSGFLNSSEEYSVCSMDLNLCKADTNPRP